MPWSKEKIYQITAEELKDGLYVNLGIGMPTHVANYIPQGVNVIFQSENGMLGMGPFPYAGEEDPDLINAGKQTITAIPESSYFDSSFSFGMIKRFACRFNYFRCYASLTNRRSCQLDYSG
ncbi:succinyl-CoA:3-ketoacid-coenzyme A transferase subunit B [Rickettsia sibirica 246]|uniref:Succinyl-CoA:3-ketoacid-coenzyme A transferase subunit B n=1 Tax=Rickettsia sibirica (strain ATCC VR-151 / 246) TaxID=272951 RepID=Q7P941_RICS2|nr:succinyl-CoA:3-ketoacid-coenzyme A transferase subunit B [Rickettsia sibirica 246]